MLRLSFLIQEIVLLRHQGSDGYSFWFLGNKVNLCSGGRLKFFFDLLGFFGAFDLLFFFLFRFKFSFFLLFFFFVVVLSF